MAKTKVEPGREYVPEDALPGDRSVTDHANGGGSVKAWELDPTLAHTDEKGNIVEGDDSAEAQHPVDGAVDDSPVATLQEEDADAARERAESQK